MAASACNSAGEGPLGSTAGLGSVTSTITGSVSSVCSTGIGSGGGISSGLIKIVLIRLGGSGGLLKPKYSRLLIATICTATVKPMAIALSLDTAGFEFFIAYLFGSVSRPT